MARCPKLDYEGHGYFFITAEDKYICTVTGEKMDMDSATVKYVCNPESGYAYEECPKYKDR